MREITRLAGFLLLLLFFAGGGYLLGRKNAPKRTETQVITQVDTCIVLDMICVSTPVFRYSYIHDTVRTYFTTIQHDTVTVDVPIERMVYAEDSLYRAVVSGWHPSLDSLTIYPTETIITVREQLKPGRWSVGITAGPSVLATPSGRVHAGLGATVGLSYRF